MKNKTKRKEEPSPTLVTFPIEIDPGAYRETYYDINKVPRKNLATINLPAARTFVSPYGWGVGSEIFFTVLPTGKIDENSITPKGAATAKGSKLTFNTVEVEIDPGKYSGIYRVGGYKAVSSASKTTVVLLADLRNFLEIYRLGYGEFVRIAVSDLGEITTSNYPGATTCTQRTATTPARVSINTRRVMLTAAAGLAGSVFVGSTAQTVKVGDPIDLVINYPVMILNNDLKLPGKTSPLGMTAGGDPLAPVPLFTFV